MKFTLGPKTFTMPSAQIPQLKLPQLKLLTAIRIPIPKAFRFGGGRAALVSILVVAGGFGASFALIINGTSDVPAWPEAVQIDSTISTLVIDSDRGSGSYIAQDSTVDRVIINTNGDNGAIIGEILIDNVDASVGAWDWDYIKAGCIVLENTNTFGNGTGINSASAVFNSSIKARVITDNLVDTPVSVK
jgi:hypothetical protein